MILTLDHTQRLQLIGMLDGVENLGRREAFAVCRLQEKLELTDEERKAIGFHKVKVEGGREIATWMPNNLAPNEYDLSEDDVKRICNAVDRYPVVLGRDKSWYVPLTAQLPQPAESNGNP